MYDAYKPMRNFLRKCNLYGSLLDVWQIACEVDKDTNSSQLPFHKEKLSRGVYQWEVPDIAREVILHASPTGTKRLDNRTALGKVINALRDTDNLTSRLRIATHTKPDDIFDELLRTAQQQFPWQQQYTDRALLRYLKIFTSPHIAPILEEVTGLTARDIFFLGLAITGSLSRKPIVNRKQSYEDFGISKEKINLFFNRITITANDLQRYYKEHNNFDRNWDFRWNPLEATPLIALYPQAPHLLLCPVPVLMLRRFSTGLYYDLYKHPKFGNAFGKAFEEYFSNVIKVVFNTNLFTIHPEQPYEVANGDTHHGPDQIITSADANLFIECKTKRLTIDAKIEPNSDAMLKDIGHIAGAIVQHYKNILEAEQGISHWRPNGLPSIPLVITLEDWFFLGEKMYDLLAARVTERLTQEGMDVSLTQKMPYAVMSAKEFEDCASTITQVGIKNFFFGKQSEEFKGWRWNAYMREQFPEHSLFNFFQAFSKDWLQVIPEQGVPEQWRESWIEQW